jgi:hypothetical protein
VFALEGAVPMIADSWAVACDLDMTLVDSRSGVLGRWSRCERRMLGVCRGDHADDMAAARRAGAIAIGVATGTSRPVGADVELEDLNAFVPWLARRPSPPGRNQA